MSAWQLEVESNLCGIASSEPILLEAASIIMSSSKTSSTSISPLSWCGGAAALGINCNVPDSVLTFSSVPGLYVTYGPPPASPPPDTRIGALRDLEPLQDTLTNEDLHYWTHGDDDEDEDTVCAILAAKDPQEALKERLHCGAAYIKEILDD